MEHQSHAYPNKARGISTDAARLSVPLICVIALGVALGSNAYGQAGKTREQVKSELAEAERVGDVLPAGEGSLTLRQRYPQRYPAMAMPAGMSREQVRAQVADAIRSGDLIEAGESGQTLRQLSPGRYPPPPAVAGKTRREVQQELADAIRTGDIVPAGESNRTLRDRYPLHYGSTGSTHAGAAASESPRN
jgi:hypothetical protein